MFAVFVKAALMLTLYLAIWHQPLDRDQQHLCCVKGLLYAQRLKCALHCHASTRKMAKIGFFVYLYYMHASHHGASDCANKSVYSS